MMSFWSSRPVLVTGCTGFLGWHLTNKLVSHGANVVGLVRDMAPRAPFFMEGLDRRITTVRGSVEDGELLARVISEYEIDTVFHLAAQAIVQVANQCPVPTFETNIRGTWMMLEACRTARKGTHLVVASSDKAYGDHDELPYNEDTPLRGSHPYDVSKSCADLLAMTYHKTYDLPVCITRCGNLFGPGDPNTSRIVPGTIRSALCGERPIIRSDGSPMRDYVFVEDIADGYLALGERMDDPRIAGQAFNLGSGEPTSVIDLTLQILRLAGQPDIEPVILNQAAGEIRHQYLSSGRARELINWSPMKSLENRLAETIDWCRVNQLSTWLNRKGTA